MAGAERAAQLAILEEALQRLEGELARDAAWRALQAEPGLDEAARAQLTRTLEANPVYHAWRNMRDAAALLRPAPAAGIDDPAAPGPMTTLAEALQQLPPDDGDAEAAAAPSNATAIDIGAQSPTDAASEPASEPPAPLTAEEREAFDVGERATQAVAHILAVSAPSAVAEPTAAAETPSPPPPASDPAPAAAHPPQRDPTDDIGHSVPLEAEDLAFLLKPASRVPAGEERPFLKRLVAEAQAAPTKATVLEPSDPFMVPPAAPPAAPEATAAQEPGPAKGEESKPRLARLLKAWSRH